jgi:hypothetical protein
MHTVGNGEIALTESFLVFAANACVLEEWERQRLLPLLRFFLLYAVFGLPGKSGTPSSTYPEQRTGTGRLRSDS